jgi:hypothetical protein
VPPSPLGYDAFQVVFAGRTKQITAATLDVLNKSNAAFGFWQETLQQPLALAERMIPQVLAVHPEQIERHEVRSAPPK